VLVGVGLLTILAAAHQARFRRSAVMAGVGRACIANLAVTMFLSSIAAAVIAMIAALLPLALTGSIRALIAATGCIVTMAALVHAAPSGPGKNAVRGGD